MADGPQYELLTDHYLGDQYLVAGTRIGDGTSYPFVSPDGKPVPPSQFMKPLNKAAEAEFDRVKNRVRNPVDSVPIRGAQ